MQRIQLQTTLKWEVCSKTNILGFSQFQHFQSFGKTELDISP